ncbi:hypothetical protein HanIR_Chr14g0687121 [Helianthus annuus]|nr:hypothetical protein HanIR_Chr14g0687121 [Helianthus annuus]
MYLRLEVKVQFPSKNVHLRVQLDVLQHIIGEIVWMYAKTVVENVYVFLPEQLETRMNARVIEI